MKSKVIWIFNQVASMLETRHLEIGKQFANHGYTCVVFTSSFHHGNHEYIFEDDITEIEKSTNVHFVYLKVKPSYNNNGLKRVLSFWGFNKKISKYSDFYVKKYGKPEYIIASSLPPLVWEEGYKIANKYNAKWIAEVKDFWPLQLTDIMGLPKWHPMVVFFGIIEKRAYKRSDAIVASMPYAYKYISEELGFPKEKVYWMANGISTKRVDENLANPHIHIPKEIDEFLEKHWTCVYCGSLVKSESVPYIVSAFNYLENYQDIYLAIIGSGHSEAEIKQAIIDNKLQDRVKMFPRVSYEQIPKILSKAKCCIAAVQDFSLYRYGLSMIKLNDYLYSGKPTIFACGYKNVVEEIDGLCIPYGNAKEIANKIIEVKTYTNQQIEKLAEKQIQEIKKNYDYEQVGNRYLALLESL